MRNIENYKKKTCGSVCVYLHPCVSVRVYMCLCVVYLCVSMCVCVLCIWVCLCVFVCVYVCLSVMYLCVSLSCVSVCDMYLCVSKCVCGKSKLSQKLLLTQIKLSLPDFLKGIIKLYHFWCRDEKAVVDKARLKVFFVVSVFLVSLENTSVFPHYSKALLYIVCSSPSCCFVMNDV